MTYRVSSAGDLLRVFGTDADFASPTAIDIAIQHHHKWQKARKAVRAKMDIAGMRGDHGVTLLELIVCREVAFQPAGEAIGFSSKDGDSSARMILRSALNILIDEWGL